MSPSAVADAGGQGNAATAPSHGRRRRRTARSLRRWGGYLALRVLIAWVRHLPLETARDVGRRLGALLFRLLRTERERAIEHLTVAFGNERSAAAIRDLALQSFRNMGRNVCEYIHLPGLTPTELQAQVARFEGRGHLASMRKAGKGVILLGAHTGNWELIAAYLVSLGVDFVVVARRIYFGPYDDLLASYRNALGLKVVYQDQGPRPLLRALRRGAVVCMLVDQDVPRIHGVFVDLFGRPAYTPSGPFSLVLATGAPLASIFPAYTAQGHAFWISPPFEFEPSGDRGRDVAALAQRWSSQFEAFVRRFPSQWVWNHRRWRTQPKTQV